LEKFRYTETMIGIVDYDIGNLRSVQKAFQHVGGEALLRYLRRLSDAL
jgi:imidazoleglycerol phosphate synthase glutamine amidotransferase subunit HisH